MPAPYVLANHILKPARAPEIMGLHYGSIAGEVRFVPETTKMWQQRFDVPDKHIPHYIEQMRKLKSDPQPSAQVETATVPTVEPSATPLPTLSLYVEGDAVCPKTGYWFCPHLSGRTEWLEEGEKMPGGRYSASNNAIIWYYKKDQAAPQN